MNAAAPTRDEAVRAGCTVAAALASFCTMGALCRAAGVAYQPAIVAAILTLGLSRGSLPARGARPYSLPFVLAVIALVASGIGRLIVALPPAGAALFVALMFLSIWLRNFGPRARRAGSAIALPLVAMLVVPPPGAPGRGGFAAQLALTAGAGVVALFWVFAVQRIAGRYGRTARAHEPAARAGPPHTRTGPSVQTRMALQMAVALALAFGFGFAVFPGHWTWTVVTAFIVCSGARGRGDAAYKGVLRLVGALCGTVAAALVVRWWDPSGVAEAAAIFVVLFFGLWLRERNYAYWACAMTLVLALLAAQPGRLELALLTLRLEAIFAGALCAVAAAWFVFPIRTTDVVRRRLADALIALDDVVLHAHAPGGEPAEKLASWEHHVARLNDIAAPLHWHRRVARDKAEHPARWIDLTLELRGHAAEFARRDQPAEASRTSIRKAIGASRRAVAAYGKPEESGAARASVGATLAHVRDTLRDA